MINGISVDTVQDLEIIVPFHIYMRDKLLIKEIHVMGRVGNKVEEGN
jgi:hypothetical protein